MLKRLGLGLLSLLIVGCAAPALSQPSGISQKVAVCDPKFANNCIKPTSGGAVPVTGTVTASTTVRSTAAAPAEVEGTDNPASGDLHGSNRSVILDAAGTAVDWTLPVVVKGNGTAGTADSAPVTVQGIASMTPVLVAGTGTAGTAATAVVTVQGIASGVAQPVSGTVTAAQATASSLNAQVVGAVAAAATASGNPVLEGCRGATTAPTAVTDGQVVYAECGVEGGRVTRPYAIKELMVRGSTGAITNTSQTSIIASAGGSLKNYITSIECANSGATTSILTFTDANATVLINPAGGGGNWVFPIPLVTAAATAFQVTPGSSSTSQYCSAQGYTGL